MHNSNKILNNSTEENKNIHTRISELESELERQKTIGKYLAESEERYRLLADVSRDMIFIVDKKDNIKFVNNYAAEQFQCMPEDIIGKNRKSLFPPEVYKHQERNLNKVLKSGKSLYVENTAIFRSNRLVWLGTWLIPIMDKGGRVNEVMGVSRDITMQKKAEEEVKQTVITLKQRNEKLAALNILINELNLLGDNLIKILQKSLSITMNSVSADFGVTFLYGNDKKFNKALASEGLSQKFLEWNNTRYMEIAKNNKDKRWASYQAFHNKRPYLIEDVKDIYEGEVLEALVDEGIFSIVAIPLIYQNDCLGMMMIGSKEGKKLELFEMDFLDSIGKHVGTVIYKKNI